jgi:glycosyltransferase involved in cell wall biosynthesis
MVSVAMVTFNHEEFIAQAIESALMQETVFDVEIVVGEDCSTDGTRAIVQGYGREYPGRVRLVVSEENVGAQRNFARVLGTCRGKYVASLEGDDYWTDRHKLQKQVDFLEANPDFVMCCHDVEMSFDGDVDRASPFKRDFPQISTFDDIWRKFFIPTPSLIFRNHAISELPDWLSEIRSGDMALELLLAHHGKCYYMFEKMAMKRRHPGGITETHVFKDSLSRLRDQLAIRKGVIDYTGRRGEAVLNDTVAWLHKRISVEYARRHDPVRSAFHLATSLLLSGNVRRDVLVDPILAAIPSSVRRLLKAIVSRVKPRA